MPSLAIIIPAFNSAATVVAALESVRAQTRLPDEVIVIDDASTDTTAEVARQWMANQSAVCNRWSVVSLERNGGPAVARNRGVAAATSEWVGFLDADDAWLPWKLATQQAFLARHSEVVMCCGGRVTMDSQGRVEGGIPSAPAETADIPWRTLDRVEMARRSPIVTSTVLLSRALFERVGGFDARFRGPEDYDLWIRIVAAGPVAVMEVPLACYRYRPGSLSMDERRFLPQVLGVLDKAYAPGGGLCEVPEWRHASIATQLQQASWMAFCRGARGAAVFHLLRAWGWMLTGRRRMAYPWAALLYRYVLGRRPAPDAR